MKIKQLKLSEIKVSDRYREDMGNLDELIRSVSDKGILQPIIVDSGYNLIAGERRFRACTELGMEKIPAVISHHTDELDKREVELIENIHRKDFTWAERAKLEDEIFRLKKSQTNGEWTQRDQVEYLGTSKGATSRRLQLAEAIELIPDLAECKTEDEAWKKYKQLEENIITQSIMEEASEKVKEVAKHAERHYLIGDAIAGLKQVHSNVLDFIEVDPPYAVELHKRKDRNQDLTHMDNYNEVDIKDYPAFLHTVMTECYRAMKDHSFMIWWFGPSWYYEVRTTLEKVGFKFSGIPAVWVKGQAGQTASPDTMLGSSYEPFFVCRKGNPKLRKPGRSNVFNFSPVAPQNKIHPTERPIELMEEVLSTFVYPGSLICIPFLGSGVTLRASYRQKLMGYGWDLDEMTKSRFVQAVFKDRVGEEKEDDLDI